MGFEAILDTRYCELVRCILSAMIFLHLYALFKFKYSESKTHIRSTLEI